VIEDPSRPSALRQVAGIRNADLRRGPSADCFAIELSARLKAANLTPAHHEFGLLAKKLRIIARLPKPFTSNQNKV